MDDQLLIIQDTIDDNKQASDEKMNTYDSKLDKMMNHNKIQITRQTGWIYQSPMILPLCYQLTRRLQYWDVEILKKWWYVDSQKGDHLTKIL